MLVLSEAFVIESIFEFMFDIVAEVSSTTAVWL